VPSWISQLHARSVARVVVCGLLFCALSCLSLRVAAEEATDPKREAEYQQLISDALDEYERGSWEEAAALFRRAHELVPSSRTLRGMGLATYEARRYAESLYYLRDALADTRRPLNNKQRAEVEATLQRAKLFVGSLRLLVEPSDAQVTINGRAFKREPDGSVFTDSGWLDVEASADGYETMLKRVRMSAGDRQELALHLTSERSAAAQSSVEQPAPQLRAAAPAPLAAAPESALSSSSVGTPDNGNALRTWKWVTAGAAVVALGAGGTMLAIQKIKAPDYEAECVRAANPPADCESRRTMLGTTLWAGSITGLALGGALTALSVTLFALDAHQSRADASPALSCAGAGDIGVSCRMRF
jgi:hypothetical protein